MGLLNFLFGKKQKNEISPTIEFVSKIESDDEDDYFYDEIYFRLISERPRITNYYGRAFDLPAYSDTFETLDNHTLREWLLLVWWGNTKNGRKKDVTIPKYFFQKYNLDAERLTATFKNEGLLEDVDDKTLLSESGRVFFNKYRSLWEIHSFKNYPTNLDLDFPTWNLQLMEIRYYEMEIKFLSDSIAHAKKLIDRLNSLGNKKMHKRIKQDLDYYTNEVNSNSIRLNDLKAKLEILKNRQNGLE
ncbi:hypothetical protein V9675_03320 [Streptococcus suis]|uniref:hypothetical protein n=1 Tax=Streptococcus suis TaxID=1307 RepID=UPI000F63D9B1|nr:hypothetical protein [Streptococcus suis]MBO4137951.1 hypothetical protein [Streptococcus suis]MBS8099371.1 hypothetical protein [Streptococcus suis]MBS8108019.1 hypothetical protein [Streptococcus suis]MBS8116816.1 hypothetical protein [Streptococcus suis]MCB2944750.1 hypothetical protein [Streptococcus suis]